MQDLFKNACRLHLDFAIKRYLMSCADGRWDGAEKALRHLEMSYFYEAVSHGVTADQARIFHDETYMAVHDATQALTDNLDTEIGFPLKGRPDYDKIAPLFFDKFHTIAIRAMN